MSVSTSSTSGDSTSGGSTSGGSTSGGATSGEDEVTSYYGRPILKQPTWKQPDVPLYLFFGGLCGAASMLAEGAALTDRPALERYGRLAAAGGAAVGTVFLIHDLGRPTRFLNMLRVFKVTSPLSIGSWILAPFATLASVAAAGELVDLPTWARPLTRAAGVGAAVLGGPLATYTAALVADTAVPAWHDAYRELPFVFAGSGMAAGGGLALVVVPLAETAPARVMAVTGVALDLGMLEAMHRRLGFVGEPYEQGRPGLLLQTARALGVLGAAGVVVGRRSRAVSALSGAALVAASVMTRFGVFQAGLASAADPKYVVVPQRDRLRQRVTGG